MAIKLSTSFVSTVVPGAYVNARVRSISGGVAVATGVIAIIGEATSGEDFSTDDLKNNYFGPDQIGAVIEKYGSGPIVDAANALAAPSADPDIPGSPNRILILKTNKGTKAESTIAGYTKLLSKKVGTAGNALSYRVISAGGETVAQATGTTIAAFGAALDGAVIGYRINGGALATATLSSTPADHATIGDLVTELNVLLTATDLEAADGGSDNLIIRMKTDSSIHTRGWGRSFILVDSTPGDLAALGLTASQRSASTEPAREIVVTNTANGTSETLTVSADIALEIGYIPPATSATLTIASNGAFTTSVSGGSGTNLSTNVNNFVTIQALVDWINAQPGYQAVASTAYAMRSPSQLDLVTAIGICGGRSGRVKFSVQNFKDQIEKSIFVDADVTATAGVPAVAATAFLAGGAKGATTSADVVDALLKAEGLTLNFIVPLFSRDATADIVDGQTDAASTYTIDAIHAAVKSSALKVSNAKRKKNRQAFLSYKGTFADAKTKATGLASFRASLAIQDVQIGTSVYQPWYLAAVAAGMQAAGFYQAIFNKLMNVTAVIDPTGFDYGDLAYLEDAIERGLLVAQVTDDGTSIVSDQTTYMVDDNFVYNSIQAVYAADIVQLDLARFIGRKFTGQSLADVDAAIIASAISERMDLYKRTKLIAASDDAPLGYRNVTVRIQGPIAYIGVEIKLATALYFMPIELEISQVTSST